MTFFTLVRPGHGGTDPGVRAVVSGGEGDKDATGGVLVGTVQPAFWKEKARAVVGGTEWVFAKEGDLVGRWSQDPDGSARLRATRVSFWMSDHDIDLEGFPVTTRGARSNRVWTSGGVEIGRSGRIGFWSPVPTITLRDDVPAHHAVFLLWLESVFVRRSQAAAAAS